ncbi:MAG TPA: glycosyltransferase family 1 protein [Microbacterium sp.]|nr:glycosyltransferase family 1 protein [Microbacterium sp.]
MKLLFDGYWWDRGPAANRSVQRELILAWAAEFPDDEIIVALRRGAAGAGLPDRATHAETRLWPHALSNFVELGRIARRHEVDAIIPHNYTPWSGASATFVHDVMFVEHPEWFSTSERAYFSAMLPTARRAGLVVTSSQTEADRIDRHLRGEHEPAVAVALGAPPAIVDARPRRPEIATGLESFALTVGRLNVRKNLLAVIEASGASEHITPTSPLVVVGSSEHSGVGADLPAEIDRLRADGRVLFAGRLDDDELAWLYRNCAVSISLSRDEGFGLTPIEAVACGAPLVVSDIPVHRENVGAVAHFVPLDAPASAAAAAIDLAWGSPSEAALRHDVIIRCDWGAVVHRYRDAVARRFSIVK